MISFIKKKKIITKKEPELIDIKGDIVTFLRKNEAYFADFEFKSIHKSKESTKQEFVLGNKILGLNLKEVFESQSKIILIPPKYEFWTYIFLAIKFVKLGYKVSFLYYSWAEKIVKTLENYSNYLEYAHLKFENVDEFNVDVKENPYVINFSDTLKGIKTTVPTFSTAYIMHSADLDAACEYIVNHAFSFAGLKKSNLKRVIVDDGVADQLVSKIERKLDLGNKFNDTKITSAKTSIQFQQIVSEAISDGAEVLQGDGIINPEEALQNVVLFHVRPDMQVFQKKFFGPLLAIVSKKDYSLEKLFKQQPSKGIVIFGEEKDLKDLSLPQNQVYAIHDSRELNDNSKVLYDHPSLEYLLRFLGI